VFKGGFFHEFVTACPGASSEVMAKLEAYGILGGYPTDKGILWCVTEMNTKAEIDGLVKILKGEA
jgi:glycine dehydrogenase subunit 1